MFRNSGCSGCLGCLIGFAIIVSLVSMAVSGMVSSCVYLVSRPNSWEATVSAVNWERVIEIERIELRSKEGSKEEIPLDAVDVKPKKGKGKRETGIFTYNVREWGPPRKLRASGTNHTNIHWPVDENAAPRLERDLDERVTQREKYYVTVSYYGDQMVRFVAPDEATFRKFPVGSKHTITPMHGHVIIEGKRYNHWP